MPSSACLQWASARIGAVDFEHPEECLALSALLDEHVDGALDAMISQKLGRAEAGIRLQFDIMGSPV